VRQGCDDIIVARRLDLARGSSSESATVPHMLRGFGVRNLKSFRTAKLPLAPLTVLVGMNAAGTSIRAVPVCCSSACSM
jgi:hypothetical protein